MHIQSCNRKAQSGGEFGASEPRLLYLGTRSTIQLSMPYLQTFTHAITRTRPSAAVRLTRCFAAKRAGDADEAELSAARQWLQKLNPETIPKDIGEVSFSRSSGPGGQNVNK